MQSQEEAEDNTILLSRNNFTDGQYHVIGVLTKTLDQTVTEYLVDIILEAVKGYTESDMVPEILNEELLENKELDRLNDSR